QHRVLNALERQHPNMEGMVDASANFAIPKPQPNQFANPVGATRGDRAVGREEQYRSTNQEPETLPNVNARHPQSLMHDRIQRFDTASHGLRNFVTNLMGEMPHQIERNAASDDIRSRSGLIIETLRDGHAIATASVWAPSRLCCLPQC